MNCEGNAENKNSFRIETNRVQTTMHHAQTRKRRNEDFANGGVWTSKLKVVYSVSQMGVWGDSLAAGRFL